MHILVINFNLEGISDEDYRGLAEPIAPAFAGLPGLVSKTWLANAETNTYGGVYVWSDRGAMEAYKETDIYKGMHESRGFDEPDSLYQAGGPTRYYRSARQPPEGRAGSTRLYPRKPRQKTTGPRVARRGRSRRRRVRGRKPGGLIRRRQSTRSWR